MAVVWGEAEVVLHTDGRALPGEVEAATQVAARTGARAFERDFGARMRRAGGSAAVEFGRNFTRALVRLLGGVPAIQALDRSVGRLRRSFYIAGRTISGNFTNALDGLRSGVSRVTTGFREFGQEVRDRGLRATEELREGFERLRITGEDVRQTFPALARGFDRVRERVTPLVDSFRTLGTRLRTMASDFREHRQSLRDIRVAFENLSIDSEKYSTSVSDGLEKIGRSARSAGRDSGSFFGHWKRLPHGFRQFTVWTTAILSAFEQLAVLGSAAGGGLLITAGALTQLGIGLGATIAVFQDLNNELDEIPENIRPAAAAFQDIGKAFNEMQDFIQETALRDAVGAFESLADTVRNLIPAFEPLSNVIGNSIGRFAEAIKPGTEAFEDLETLIRNSAPTFQTILDTAGKLGGALLDAFANPTMQRAIEGLVGWVEDLVDTFDEFVASDDFVRWIENSVEVLSEFGGLLEGIGEVLNNLVDQEAVERTTAMIDALTDSLPMFEALLSTLGELDVFGLIAEAFAALTPLLTPLFQVLEPIAAIVRDVLLVAFNNLAIVMSGLSALLLPARILWEGLAAVFDAFVEWITPVQDALLEVGGAIQEASDKIILALTPAFDAIAQAITDMLPSPEEFARFIREELVPAIEDLTSWIINEVVPAIEDFARWLREEGVPAAQDFWRFMSEKLIPLFETIVSGIGGVIRAFGDLGRGIRDTVRNIAGPIQDAIEWFQSLFGAANAASGAASSAGGGGRGRLTAASGRILTGPANVYAGEAGPEAIVPLRRALSQVDPSVRWLSAIAQGKDSPYASGGIVGASGSAPTVMISDGGIIVTEAGDPNRTANEVVNRIFERVAG